MGFAKRATLLRWCETAGRRTERLAKRLVVFAFHPGQTGLIARRNESLRDNHRHRQGQDRRGGEGHQPVVRHPANIEALEEQVTRGQFSMTIQASWKAASFDENALGQGLRALGRELGMEIKWWFTDPKRPQRMALMVTKEPHCLDAILAAVNSGKLKADIGCVIGNHRDLQAKAEKAGLPFRHVSWANRAKAEEKVLKILEKAEVDFVVLARFMKILSPNFVWRFKTRSSTFIRRCCPVFRAATVSAGVRTRRENRRCHGALREHALDEGPIIAQESFRIKPGMTLKQIVATGQPLEARALVNGIRLYLTRQLDVHWGVVKQV